MVGLVTGAGTNDEVAVRLLGPFEVLVRGMAAGPAGGKRRGLLAVLALHAGRVVAVSDLVDWLWGPAPPASAVNLVQTYVSDWRAALAPGRRRGAGGPIATVGSGYRLTVGPDAVDLCRFNGLAARARAASRGGDRRYAVTLFAEALGLWRGPVLADLAGQPWHTALTEPVEQARLAAVQEWASSALESGAEDPARVAAVLSQDAARYPLDERLAELLMWALVRQGRQGDALMLHETMRRRLAQTLGVDPGPGLAEMFARVLRQDAQLTAVPTRSAPAAADPAQRGSGPSRADILPVSFDSFLGREKDLQAVIKLLGSARVVTLTGPGGSGKTRLAVEVAARANPPMAEDVFFVDASLLTDPGQLPGRLAQALGLEVAAADDLFAALGVRLGDRPALVVLDNMEHLLPEIAVQVPSLLSAAAGLRLLVTSREALKLRGEQVYPVAPLPVNSALPEEPAAAVELFWDRATAADPTVARTPCGDRAAIEICRRVDGLPLAVELAAAWTGVLPLPDLAVRLAEPLSILTEGGRDRPERHHTLRATIDWSYQLLTTDERALLTDLGVFPAGMDLEALTVVCQPDLERPVLQVVAGLVHRSLLRTVPGAAPRFRLLETVRAYAEEQLQLSDREHAVRDRHAAHYRGLAEELARRGNGPEAPHWVRLARAEVDNMRAAIEHWSRTGRPDLALQMVADCPVLWWDAGFVVEGLHRLETCLGAASPDAPARPFAHAYAAWLAGSQLRSADADAHAARAVSLAREAGDVLVEAYAWRVLGNCLGEAGYDEMRRRLQVALELVARGEAVPVRYSETAPAAVAAGAASCLASRLLWRDLTASRRWAEESLRWARQQANPLVVSFTLAQCAEVGVLQGDLHRADRLLTEADRIFLLQLQEIGGPRYRMMRASVRTQLAHQSGDLAAAERLARETIHMAAEGGRLNVRPRLIGRLARILLDRGQGDAARVELDAVEEPEVLPPSIRVHLLAPRARLARLTGFLHEAAESLEEIDGLLDPASLPPERLLWYVEAAHVLHARRDDRGATELLDRAEAHAAQVGLVMPVDERHHIDGLRQRLSR